MLFTFLGACLEKWAKMLSIQRVGDNQPESRRYPIHFIRRNSLKPDLFKDWHISSLDKYIVSLANKVVANCSESGLEYCWKAWPWDVWTATNNDRYGRGWSRDVQGFDWCFWGKAMDGPPWIPFPGVWHWPRGLGSGYIGWALSLRRFPRFRRFRPSWKIFCP